MQNVPCQLTTQLTCNTSHSGHNWWNPSIQAHSPTPTKYKKVFPKTKPTWNSKSPIDDFSSEESSSVSVESKPSWYSPLLKQLSNTGTIPCFLAIAQYPIPEIPKALHLIYSSLGFLYLTVILPNLASSTSCYFTNAMSARRLAIASPPNPLYLSLAEHTKANLSLSLSKKSVYKE